MKTITKKEIENLYKNPKTREEIAKSYGMSKKQSERLTPEMCYLLFKKNADNSVKDTKINNMPRWASKKVKTGTVSKEDVVKSAANTKDFFEIVSAVLYKQPYNNAIVGNSFGNGFVLDCVKQGADINDVKARAFKLLADKKKGFISNADLSVIEHLKKVIKYCDYMTKESPYYKIAKLEEENANLKNQLNEATEESSGIDKIGLKIKDLDNELTREFLNGIDRYVVYNDQLFTAAGPVKEPAFLHEASVDSWIDLRLQQMSIRDDFNSTVLANNQQKIESVLGPELASFYTVSVVETLFESRNNLPLNANDAQVLNILINDETYKDTKFFEHNADLVSDVATVAKLNILAECNKAENPENAPLLSEQETETKKDFVAALNNGQASIMDAVMLRDNQNKALGQDSSKDDVIKVSADYAKEDAKIKLYERRVHLNKLADLAVMAKLDDDEDFRDYIADELDAMSEEEKRLGSVPYSTQKSLPKYYSYKTLMQDCGLLEKIDGVEDEVVKKNREIFIERCPKVAYLLFSVVKIEAEQNEQKDVTPEDSVINETLNQKTPEKIMSENLPENVAEETIPENVINNIILDSKDEAAELVEQETVPQIFSVGAAELAAAQAELGEINEAENIIESINTTQVDENALEAEQTLELQKIKKPTNY